MKSDRETDARKLDHQTLQAMRQRAVKAVRDGESPEDVAKVLGINRRTIYRWIAAFNDGGQNALLAKPIPGRPSVLSDEELLWLYRNIAEKTPQQFKLDFGLWTINLIRHLIEYHLGKKLSPATVHRVVRNLGFTPQKPLYRAWQQDAQLVRTWESETFPEIRARAKALGATIYFADEAGMRSDYHTGTTWSLRGSTPVVQPTGKRFSLNMLSAISPRGEMRFMVHEGSVNAEVFLTYLKRLMTGATAPIFLIVDGHSIHKAKIITDFVKTKQGMLEIFYLPPYSPQLNPDETVWAHLKRTVSRKIVKDINDMKALVHSTLRSIQRQPEKIRSFFKHPETQYIL